MENEEIYRFLFNLQKRSVCNMLGAAPYLMAEFGLSKLEAKDVLLYWCDNCEEIANNLGIDF